MPSLFHRGPPTKSSSGSSSSPKLETLSLSPSTSSSNASLPTLDSPSGNPKSILRTSTVGSTSSSSRPDSLFQDSLSSRTGNGSSSFASPRTSLHSSSASASVSLGAGVSLDDGVLTCTGLSGTTCCYAILALSRHNVLQFINLPGSLHTPILHAVQDAWPQGISSHGVPKDSFSKTYDPATTSPMLSSEVWEVHLNGTVWGARGTRAGVSVRRLMSAILSALAKQNYVLCAAIDASGKDSSKDTLYLRREEGAVSEIPTQFFSMSFQDDDKVWLIDAPQAVVESVEDHINAAWTAGIKHSGPLAKEPGCHEIKLKGTPWSTHSHSLQISSRMLHLHLLRAVYIKGFSLKGAIALADKDEGEMDTLFFESMGEVPN
ncbi:hypothetical protein BDY24DRAFT_63689 [Mrakia frigida]|uniref:uncharacterized protein n=1 Tax=Mrakia frigida TaxID=29902 RepID=UPI003FCC1D43